MLKNFWGSSLSLAIAIAISFWFWGFNGVYIVAFLALLEVSLSFDNAVVNAKVLAKMEPIWRRRFIVWGIPIAVFGVRFVLPVLLVAAVSEMTIAQTFSFAFSDPARYAAELENGQNLIHAFGGAFLLMVAMDFYFDRNREVHWIKALENNLLTRKIAAINSISVIIAVIIGIVLLAQSDSASVGIAYFGGVAIYEIINKVDELVSQNNSGATTRNGVAGFIYLETLDASFSLDGVVGAFALSTNIFMIMIGLGVGALFVRSLTLYFVAKGTLAEYRYLEHGAHYAIFALAAIMLIKIFFHISEFITGSIGAMFILLAFCHSVVANRKIL
ncbi:MAG: DUF475 domain-containing protein [Helicobacteraceae bacterium]|jgi:hypothetical protein|nr:DUF475 domain-containing protein [Helicobacteraceae bacterium]